MAVHETRFLTNNAAEARAWRSYFSAQNFQLRIFPFCRRQKFCKRQVGDTHPIGRFSLSLSCVSPRREWNAKFSRWQFKCSLLYLGWRKKRRARRGCQVPHRTALLRELQICSISNWVMISFAKFLIAAAASSFLCV